VRSTWLIVRVRVRIKPPMWFGFFRCVQLKFSLGGRRMRGTTRHRTTRMPATCGSRLSTAASIVCTTNPLWQWAWRSVFSVFKAHRLVYPSTLGLRVIKKKKGEDQASDVVQVHQEPPQTAGLAFSVRGLGYEVQGSGFRVQGSGFRVQRRGKAVGFREGIFPRNPRCGSVTVRGYRGISLIRKRTPLGPYRGPMPRVLGGS